MIFPNEPEKAAEYAKKMSSISHDNNGVYGGQFIASMISQAFGKEKILNIIEKSLDIIKSDSEYAEMVKDIVNFYKHYPNNWRKCLSYVKNNYNYTNYLGKVPIIPNGAIIILALLYSNGNFSKGINIANMCGWDTDCNVGNVGTIIGVIVGVDGIKKKWKTPINDFVCCSSLIGSLNILDIPYLATYTAKLSYKIHKENPPSRWTEILDKTNRYYHFEFPDSTHAFKLEDKKNNNCKIENTSIKSKTGLRSLKLDLYNIEERKSYKLFNKTYYYPDDFEDSRYDPAFSPVFYPGQSIKASIFLDEDDTISVKARLFIADSIKELHYFNNEIILKNKSWNLLKFKVPKLTNICIDKIGIEIIPLNTNKKNKLTIFIDDIELFGLPNYKINFNENMIEKWNFQHEEIKQFTYLRGSWSIVQDKLSGSGYGEPAEIYTGNINWSDYIYTAKIVPKIGNYHNINFRVKGGILSYAVGLAADNKLKLYKKNKEYKTLKSIDYNWLIDKEYNFKVVVNDNIIEVFINGSKRFDFKDNVNPILHGQIGFSNLKGSRTLYKGYSIKGLKKHI